MNTANPEDSAGASGESQPENTETAAVDAAKEQQEEEWRTELARLEYEIQTLRSVLAVKTHEASELKRKLGITSMSEFKEDLRHGVQSVRESDVYQKTNAALHNFGDYASKKLGAISEDSSGVVRPRPRQRPGPRATCSRPRPQMLYKSSSMYKSFEEKVGGAYTSVKTRVTSSKSENNLDNTGTELSASEASGNLPEDKVPL